MQIVEKIGSLQIQQETGVCIVQCVVCSTVHSVPFVFLLCAVYSVQYAVCCVMLLCSVYFALNVQCTVFTRENCKSAPAQNWAKDRFAHFSAVLPYLENRSWLLSLDPFFFLNQIFHHIVI